VSGGVKELEGTVGKVLEESSEVQAIISLYGASNLQTILAQSTPHGLSVRVPALQLLLGGQPEEKPELAKLGSPVAHVDAKDPPLLLIHGNADPQMPYEQSLELKAAYEKAGLKVQLITIPGGKHGGKEFYDAERTKVMAEFLSSAGKQ
jgi:dipeptidyl aminopeptidase/acylaminoacyl peptidase